MDFNFELTKTIFTSLERFISNFELIRHYATHNLQGNNRETTKIFEDLCYKNNIKQSTLIRSQVSRRLPGILNNKENILMKLYDETKDLT